MNHEELTVAEARRIALAAQGFDRPRPARRVGASDVRRAIHQLGLLQIDFANVLIPSHYLVLFSRLGAYDRSLLDNLVHRHREFIEAWAHEASIVPVDCWPLLRHRRERHRVRPWGFETFLEEHPEYVAAVLEEVRARGPLAAGDLGAPDGAPRRIAEVWSDTVPEALLETNKAWLGTVPRAVLEAHFGRGLLAIANRLPDFTRIYDLAERVVPAEHHPREVSREDAERELLLRAAKAHGVATASDLADYYRMPPKDARPRLAELVEQGMLSPVRIAGSKEAAYLHPAAKRPKRIVAAALLSPFDPVVWFRARASRLFQFDYRFDLHAARQAPVGMLCVAVLI
jgi:uncharacterized protein YcaQ